MDYVINCPHCKQTMLATPDLAGQTVLCPHCAAELVMPPPDPDNITPPRTSTGDPPISSASTPDRPGATEPEDTPKSFTAKFSELAKAALHEGQRNAHLVSTKAKVEKLRLVDLPRAHLVLGQKSYAHRLQSASCRPAYEKIDGLQQEIETKRAGIAADGGPKALDKAKHAALSTKLLAETKVLEHQVRQRLTAVGEQAAACPDWPECAEEIGAVAAIVAQIAQHEADYARTAQDFSERTALKNLGASLAAEARTTIGSRARTAREFVRAYWAKPYALPATVAAIVLGAGLMLILWMTTGRSYETSQMVKQSVAFEEYGQRGVKAADVRDFRHDAWWGDPIAQYKLSVCYINGRGVEKDPEEGFRWLEKSAHGGNPVAQVTLGGMYFRGITPDGEENPEEGLRWMRRAADQGDARSEGALGLMYYQGMGVRQDKDEGLKWLRQAAAKGDETVIDFMKQAGIRDPAVDKASRRFDINEYSAQDQEILRRLSR